MYNETIENYLSLLGSKSPVPGGGSVAALSASLGVSLGRMVISLTLGKKRYAAVEQELLKDEEELEDLEQTFQRLEAKDQEAFLPLSRAYGLPRDTEKNERIRNLVMEQALQDAALVPLSLVETLERALIVLLDIAQKGSKLAISDVTCGAAMLEAAMKCGAANVEINLKSMKTEETRDALQRRLSEAVRRNRELLEKIEEAVAAR